MRKLKIDPATQQRPTSRKQNRNAKIKEQLTQQVAVQIIPAKADMEGYEKPKPRVCAYCRVSTDMDTQALSFMSCRFKTTQNTLQAIQTGNLPESMQIEEYLALP